MKSIESIKLFKESTNKATICIVCRRCRKRRNILLFWQNNLRLSLCKNCRDYNIKYQKKLRATAASP
jgi:NMD protein affecting ribosome stability and mRNA decay